MDMDGHTLLHIGYANFVEKDPT